LLSGDAESLDRLPDFATLSQPFTSMCLYLIISDVLQCYIEVADLKCVFAGEALITVTTWEGLYSQMNALVSLKIVIAIKALHTLVALE